MSAFSSKRVKVKILFLKKKRVFNSPEFTCFNKYKEFVSLD